MANSQRSFKGSNDRIDIALVKQDIVYIREKVNDIGQKMERDYVTSEEFDPIKKIVYGLVTLILTAVVGGFMYLLIGQHPVSITLPK